MRREILFGLLVISILFLGGCQVTSFYCYDLDTAVVITKDQTEYRLDCQDSTYTVSGGSGANALNNALTTCKTGDVCYEAESGSQTVRFYKDSIYYSEGVTWNCDNDGWRQCLDILKVTEVKWDSSIGGGSNGDGYLTIWAGSDDYIQHDCFECSRFIWEDPYECQSSSTQTMIKENNQVIAICQYDSISGQDVWYKSEQEIEITPDEKEDEPNELDEDTDPTETGKGQMDYDYGVCLFEGQDADIPDELKEQMDSDGDGLNDAVDPCPLDPSNVCGGGGNPFGLGNNPLGPIETPLDGCTLNEDCLSGQKCQNGICVDDPYPEGDDNVTEYDQCPDDFDDYMGQIFKLEEGDILDTRDRQFRDAFGDYPTDFEFGYDVELEVLDSADRQETCWFFIRALEIYDGDEPEFYVKFSAIEDYFDMTECETDADCVPAECCHADSCVHIDNQPDCANISCSAECKEDTLDCGQGSCLCQDGKCIADIHGEPECEVDADCGQGYYCDNYVCVETDKDLYSLIGFYPVTNEQMPNADDLGALSAGYYDSENTADLDIDDEGLDLFIKTDDNKYRDNEDIEFKDIDFSEIIYDDNSVKGYWIIDKPCDDGVDIDDLTELYDMFAEENSDIPVMIRFEDLNCALDYVEDADYNFTNIILFDLQDIDEDAVKAQEILDKSKSRIKIIPLVNVMQNNAMMSAENIKDLGLEVIEKDSFYGIIFEPYDNIDAVKNKIDYRNAFAEVFCRAEEVYYGKDCDFEPEEVDEVKIAFIGNTAVGVETEKVLELINRQEADLVVHLGNLAYDSTASEFADMLSKNLSENIEFLAVIGNEEFSASNWADYTSKLGPWYENLDCEGAYGNKMVCYVDGVQIILSGVGTDFMTQGHETFITEKLSVASDWSICAWHKANKDLRISNKDVNDNLGMNYYNLCKNAQAIIATGYDQAYARTKLLTSLSPIQSQQEIDLSKGTLAFLSGLGGHSYDRYDCIQHDDDNWWASVYTSNIYKNEMGSSLKSCDQDVVSDIKPGVMFITFNYNENANVAKAEFINIDNERIDSFNIYKDGESGIGKNCQNFPPSSFCPEGADDIMILGTDDNDCPIYGCESQQVECVPEGVSFNPSIGPADPYYGKDCCEGLEVMAPMAKYNADCSPNDLVGYSVMCSDCGNGICETENGENICNCKKSEGGDCPEE